MNLGPYFGAIFTAVVVLLVAILNTWAFKDDLDNNTISAWITYGSDYAAAIPFALGAVIGGHWASRDMNVPHLDHSVAVLFGITLLLLLVDIVTKGALAKYPYILWFLSGITPGAILWPMSKIAA